MSEEIKKGLLGIVVDETTISHVVPELSTLTYRGYTVQELCDKCDFEEVAYLVLNGDLPNKKQLKNNVTMMNDFGGLTSDQVLFCILMYFNNSLAWLTNNSST